jgi:hypothetical protein
MMEQAGEVIARMVSEASITENSPAGMPPDSRTSHSLISFNQHLRIR